MYTRAQKIVFFLFLIIILFLGAGYSLLKMYDTKTPFSTKTVVRDTGIQTRDNELGKFTRTNFGFDVDMSSEEYIQMGMRCDDMKTSDTFGSQNIPGKVVCVGGSSDISLWIGWKKEAYLKVDYLRDIGNQILNLVPGSVPGELSCKGDPTFSWYAKMPATVTDCSLVSGGKVYNYSVLFFYPNKVSGISQVITVFSLDTRVTDQAKIISQKLRSFGERVRYLESSIKKQSFLFVKSALAYGAPGGDGGDSCSATGCAPGESGAVSGAAPGGADPGGTIPDPVCANGATDYPACTPSVTCVSNYGNSCQSPANACGQTNFGRYACDGSCVDTGGTPPNPSWYNQSCSVSNACGTSYGTYDCAGNCSAVSPPVTQTNSIIYNCVDTGDPFADPPVCVSGGTAEWVTYCDGSSGWKNSTCYEVACAPIINSSCSATHYNCNSGSLGATGNYADQWQWWCNGSNGGSNILCAEMKPIYSCQGSIPVNASMYAGDSAGLSNNTTNYTYSGSNTAPLCQYGCDSYYNWNGSSCNLNACQGSIPANGTMWPNDNVNLTDNTTNYSYWASDTGTRCQYFCKGGYSWNGSSCVAIVTSPTEPTGQTNSCDATGTQVTLSWNAVAGATSYPVRVDDPAGSCNGGVTGPASFYCTGGTEYVNDGLTGSSITVNITPGKTYNWWVHAINANGWSSYTSHSFSCPVPSVYVCTGTPPANATAWNATAPVSNTAYAYSATDGICKYKCDSYYNWNGSSCNLNACQGSIPANGTMWPNDNVNLTDNTTNYSYWASDTGTRCQYFCKGGYSWNGSSCAVSVAHAPIVSLVPTTPEGINLGGSVSYNVSATDTGNDMTKLNFDFKGPNGIWNWQGDGQGGATISSQNFSARGSYNFGTAFTPSIAGTYIVRAAALDGVNGWAWSGERTITVCGTSSTWNGSSCISGPTLTFVASSSTVVSGGSVSLEWNTTNAVSCTASGDWNDSITVSNGTPQNVTKSGLVPPDKTYTLTCKNSANVAIVRSVNVAVVVSCISRCSNTSGNYCSGVSFTTNNSCGASENCTGTRSCGGSNWVEVAP